MDWAIKLIEKIKDTACTDAEYAFVEAYKNGDGVEAFTEFASKAIKDITLDDGRNTCLIFPDGSTWISWGEDTDQFYETTDDLVYDWPELKEWA